MYRSVHEIALLISEAVSEAINMTIISQIAFQCVEIFTRVSKL